MLELSIHRVITSLVFMFTLSQGFTQNTGEWTWVAGSNSDASPVFGTQGIPSVSNTPGYSYESRNWVDDQGDFWLYGGLDINSGATYCDLWRFNPTTAEWTWMKGNGQVDQLPVFGTQGVPSAAVNPGICNLGNSTCKETCGYWNPTASTVVFSGNTIYH
jgi:hypothetical protein